MLPGILTIKFGLVPSNTAYPIRFNDDESTYEIVSHS